MPVRDGAGRITELQGQGHLQDRASASRRATRPGCSTAPSGRSTGTCPWTRTLSGAGKAIEPAVIKDLIKDGPDPSPEGLEPQARRGQRVRGLLDRRSCDEAHAGRAHEVAVRRPRPRPDVLQEHLRRRSTPRRRSSRSRSRARRPTQLPRKDSVIDHCQAKRRGCEDRLRPSCSTTATAPPVTVALGGRVRLGRGPDARDRDRRRAADRRGRSGHDDAAVPVQRQRAADARGAANTPCH